MSENCLESKYMTKLTEVMIDNFIPAYRGKDKDIWVDQKTALIILNVSSTTTLQGYRDMNKIIYSALSKKKIVYEKKSLLDFLEKESNRKNYGG